MQFSRKALIFQLTGPQIYRENRRCYGEVRIWDFILSYKNYRNQANFEFEIKNINFYRIAIPNMQNYINNSRGILNYIKIITKIIICKIINNYIKIIIYILFIIYLRYQDPSIESNL